MPKLSIVTEGGRYEFENDSVANVADLLAAAAPILNIGANATIAVNGVPATPETPVTEGDEVSTMKPAGTKGQ